MATATDTIATLAAAARAAKAAVETATTAEKAAKADLLAAMLAADLKSIKTPSGTVSVCSGRRTVRVTCKALQAEIKLMQERAVRTGRAVENTGEAYVTIR
jgi:hypothetical protein